MSAGLQVWNDALTFQIDGSTPMVTLARKGTAASQGTDFPTNGANAFCLVRIPISDGEILAVDCGLPFHMTGIRNGAAEFAILGATSTSMDYWVFAPHTDSGIRFGMKVFSETGALIYDTGRPPMRVAGTVEGVGTFGGFPTGRRLALVVWAQHTYIQRRVLVNPIPNTGFTSVSGNFARCAQDGTVYISPDTSYAIYQAALSGSTISFAGDWDNGLQNKYTVADVTGM
ncbi:hypothetical protein [Paraburkholderia sp. J76]|uniref:hypothetical protein n=1 Tax=Paraburkholderia sp. J76 TaxID=2805439 RepID=UPI002ABE7C13|nr:hypothetical protein [Paraburkholderia sp. J76]